MARRIKRKRLWFTLGIILVVVVVVFILEVTNTTHIFHKAAVVRAPSKPITHLNTTTKQDQQSSNTTTTKNPATPTSSIPQGEATDNNGKSPASVSTDPSQWSTSSSRLITLKAPLQNAKLSPGDPIYGSAASGPVQYRLIDNQAGEIAQGTISVVNGNFSASVNFKAYSSGGRLDVYNTDANGKETNEVQIPVNF